MQKSNENPLLPMGAITGKPDRKIILETLTALKEVGITQYLLYPRSGCELEYLSEEWFDTCRIFLRKANDSASPLSGSTMNSTGPVDSAAEKS